jgi:DUF4097 and DUF4098 domain-containing protein YvlB
MFNGLNKLKLLVLMAVCLSFGTANLAASADFESLSEAGVGELRVDASMLDVEIYGRVGFAVDGRAEDLPDNLIVNYRRQGTTLYVWVEKKYSLFPTRGRGKLVFQVPRGIDLEIETSSGTVSIQDIDSDSVEVSASSGSIRLSAVSGEIDVESSSGGLYLDRIDGALRAQSTSGRIEVNFLDGDLAASASSGSIRLSGITGDIDTVASSGRIELDSVRGRVRAETSSGSINGDNVWITDDSVFKTSSGGIDIDLENPLSTFQFSLSSSSGSLKAGEIRGNKALQAGSGSIRITGNSSSGSQRYR